MILIEITILVPRLLSRGTLLKDVKSCQADAIFVKIAHFVAVLVVIIGNIV